jgi:hypothetical protein
MFKKLFLLGMIVSTGYSFAFTEDQMAKSIVQVKTYNSSNLSPDFFMIGHGSGVFVGKNQILTNAHVVLSSSGHAYGLYEICRTVNPLKSPECFSTARIVSYDIDADLALLELDTPLKKVDAPKILTKDLKIAENILAYGYPAIGGASITRTEGKVGGFVDEEYKFDGTIDHGNSGGGIFNAAGDVVGIARAVASDNGVIGYFIPAKTVQSFLKGKTENYEIWDFSKHGTEIYKRFQIYIKRIQKIYKNPNLVKNTHFTAKDFEKKGFQLFSAVETYDGKSIDIRFKTKNNQNVIALQCASRASAVSTVAEDEEDTKNMFQYLKNTIPGATIEYDDKHEKYDIMVLTSNT